MGKSRKDFKVLLVYPNLPLMLVPPLALGIFTRLLREQGYVVDLFDTTHYKNDEPTSPQNRVKYLQARNFDESNDLGVSIRTGVLEDFRRKTLGFQPDLMLFSVVEDAFLQAVRLLESVDDLEIPHVVGGVFPSAAPERCFDFPAVRMIALGEGERTVVAASEAVRRGEPLHQVPGTWCRGGDGTIHRNPQPPLVDLDAHRPDFSLFDPTRFYRPMGGRIFKTIPVETYRGCPYSCTFCNSPGQLTFSREQELGKFLRRKSMSHLRRELAELRDLYAPEFFYFIDDSFLARRQSEVREFCEMYQEFRLPFWFNTRPENCNPENLALLKEAGCYRISFGIECGNEEYRKRVLLRNVSNAQIVRQFEIIARSGIAFSINLIIGMPGETRELVMDTVDLVRSLRGYDALTVSVFTPYHGTVLRRVAERNGWLEPKVITKHTTAQSLLRMPPPYLGARDIDGLLRVLPLYCYFPKEEWEAIRRAETDDAKGNQVLEHYSELYRVLFLGEDQDAQKSYPVLGGTGCRSNPKDTFRVSPRRLSPDDITLLTM